MTLSSSALQHILLVTDMDDTLLNVNKEISAEDLSAIATFRAAGGTFSIATGRSIHAFLPYADRVALTVPVILNNGGMVYDLQQEKVLWESLLPTDTIAYVESVMAAFPHVGVEVLTQTGPYVLKKSALVEQHLTALQLECIEQPLPDRSQPLCKVSFVVEADEMKSFYPYLQEHPLKGTTLSVNGPLFCELIPADSSKATGVRHLVKHLGLEDKKIYTIGDYFNDIPLLEVGDVSSTMRHAPQEVQQKADLIFNTDHALSQLIAHIIEQEVVLPDQNRKG